MQSVEMINKSLKTGLLSLISKVEKLMIKNSNCNRGFRSLILILTVILAEFQVRNLLNLLFQVVHKKKVRAL